MTPIWVTMLVAVLDSGERWAELVLTSPATAPVVKEADEEFHHAVRTMRDYEECGLLHSALVTRQRLA